MGPLGSGKPNVRSLARRRDTGGLIDAVFYRGPDSAAGVDDAGAPIREAAVRALAAAGPDVGLMAVVDALTDSSDIVRRRAVRVLAGWGSAVPLAEAVGRIPADRGYARRLARMALERLAQPGTACPLGYSVVHALDDDPLRPGDADLVLRLLMAEEHPDAVDELLEVLVAALGDRREAVRERSAELLVRLGPASARAVIDAFRASQQPLAASVLGRIGDPSALGPLMESLQHADSRVRSESCIALGELRHPAAAEALLSATRDADPTVRANAGESLDRLGNAAVILVIFALLRPVIEEAVDSATFERRTNANGGHLTGSTGDLKRAR